MAKKIIKAVSKSEEDGLGSAWNSVIQTQGLKYSQICVTLKNGTVYESFGLGDFNDFHNGPCILGSDGSVALYVTHITDPGAEIRKVEDVENDYGQRMTIVPAAEVAEVDVRRIRI